MPLETAERDYLVWTNRLLTNARTKAKRAGDYWAYVQVTERQSKTREHPHSHIITTFLPDDARATKDAKQRDTYVSRWFSNANESAGLGSQHAISRVESAGAVARYVAKYLFKDSMRQTFPPKWKRIRYSANFPALVVATPDYAGILLSIADWRAASRQSVVWVAENEVIYQMALHRGVPVVHKAKDA